MKVDGGLKQKALAQQANKPCFDVRMRHRWNRPHPPPRTYGAPLVQKSKDEETQGVRGSATTETSPQAAHREGNDPHLPEKCGVEPGRPPEGVFLHGPEPTKAEFCREGNGTAVGTTYPVLALTRSTPTCRRSAPREKSGRCCAASTWWGSRGTASISCADFSVPPLRAVHIRCTRTSRHSRHRCPPGL